jgi:hypothetical protein
MCDEVPFELSGTIFKMIYVAFCQCFAIIYGGYTLRNVPGRFHVD